MKAIIITRFMAQNNFYSFTKMAIYEFEIQYSNKFIKIHTL